MKTISVIIPVYNVSVYIERCIKSVIAQSYTDIECIIVDDASPDDSIDKCKKMLVEYEGPIKFIFLSHNENRGLSAARNTGTLAATGEFIFYLDSDDEIEPNCLEKLIAIAFKNDEAEMVMGNYLEHTLGGQVIAYIKTNTPSGLLDSSVFLPCFMQFKFPAGAWNKLMKRSFIVQNKLFFKEGIIYEDLLWIFYVLKVLHHLYVCKDVTYHYHIRSGSIVTSSSIYTIANSNRLFIDEILHNLTPGRESEELNLYLSRFCYSYLLYKVDMPAYKDSYAIYRDLAKKYGSGHALMMLRTAKFLGLFGKPTRALNTYITLRKKIKREF